MAYSPPPTPPRTPAHYRGSFITTEPRGILHMPDVDHDGVEHIHESLDQGIKIFVLSSVARGDHVYVQLLDPLSDPSNERPLGWILAQLGDRKFIEPCEEEEGEAEKDQGSDCIIPLGFLGSMLGLSPSKKEREKEMEKESSEKRNFLATYQEVKRERKNEGGER